MKKVLALVLTLTLLTVPLYAAVATGVDFSSMTDEELTALKQQLDAEMLERGMVKTAEIQAGDYTIGVDIPQGDYELINEVNETGVVYYRFPTQEDYKNGTNEQTFWPLNMNDTAKITLSDSQVLCILLGTVRMTTFSVQWQ